MKSLLIIIPITLFSSSRITLVLSVVCGFNEERCINRGYCFDIDCEGVHVKSSMDGHCKCRSGFIRSRLSRVCVPSNCTSRTTTQSAPVGAQPPVFSSFKFQNGPINQNSYNNIDKTSFPLLPVRPVESAAAPPRQNQFHPQQRFHQFQQSNQILAANQPVSPQIFQCPPCPSCSAPASQPKYLRDAPNNIVHSLYHVDKKDHMLSRYSHEVSGATSKGNYGYEATIGRIATSRSDVLPSCGDNIVPLYRLYRSGDDDHLYTVHPGDVAFANRGLQYREEGVFGYCSLKPNCGATVALERFYNPHAIDHLYTTSIPTKLQLINDPDWTYEGTECYIWP